ncbi:MAG TPA: hypothetical protein DCP75_16025, partial [Haliea salexigens]|nr:hypothetical protein [Haliea salexigens]
MNLRSNGLLAIVLGLLSSAVVGAESLASQAHQLIEQRCVVCHACYDAPCQLKMEAHEGLVRGGSQTLVYDSTRLLAG